MTCKKTLQCELQGLLSGAVFLGRGYFSYPYMQD